jgi:hypothetical protein
MNHRSSTSLFTTLMIVATLVSPGCQSARDDSSFPTLHPRERALYTRLVLEPGGTELRLASLTRQRIQEQFTVQATDGSGIDLEVDLIADREAESLYGGTLQLRSSDGSWSMEYQLTPRSSGRWQFTLDPSTSPLAAERLLVEVEPDPYWEMDQQRPRRLTKRR